MEDLITRFVTVGCDFNYGYGYGYSCGYGNIDGSGDGEAYGYGYVDGSGGGDGYGDGYVDGSGDGSGDGPDNGDGYGDGKGYGRGIGYGMVEYNGAPVHYIDNEPTVIESVRDCGTFLAARGSIVRGNLTLSPCYIVRIGDYFAHGDTLRAAYDDAQGKQLEKQLEKRSLEERLDEFVKIHPDPDEEYGDLFTWHHILTGSCRRGREEWCLSHGLQPTDSITVRRFILETKGNYGGNVIRQLARKYGITI